MAYAASVVRSSIKDATVRDLNMVNKFIKLLECNELALSFPQINDLQNVSLVCFSDASFANLKWGGSQGGLLVFPQGRNGKYIASLILKRPKSTYPPIIKRPKSRYPPILKRPMSIFMKIEIFVFFESVNQHLSFHVHNAKFLSQEPLKKLSGTL